MSVDLSTKYLGLELKNPLVIASCPLTESLDNLRKMEEAGAAAAVLPSLFEEQVETEDFELGQAVERGSEAYAEHSDWYPEPEEYIAGPDKYLDTIRQAKKAVSMPIIASLNGTTAGGWIRYAKMMEEAGADALELNIYFIPGDVDLTGAEVEQQYVDLVSQVKGSISIPLGVKVGPYFSSPGHMAKRLVEAGADGLVIFNRFIQPDINLDAMETWPRLVLSTAPELLISLRWIAIMHGRVDASIAVTSGIHSAEGLVKSVLVGADVGMIASVLYRKGLGEVRTILDGFRAWMEEKEYQSVEQMKGSMSQENCPDSAAFARGNYMKTLTSFTGQPI